MNNNIKQQLINMAIDKFKCIFPISGELSADSSFTIENNIMYFWFNTEDTSTHIISKKI